MSLAVMLFTPGISNAYLTERRPDAAKPSRIVIPLSHPCSKRVAV